MKNFLKVAIVAILLSLPQLAFTQATDLFFSEYIEGSSFNKYIEIFNGTGSSVDLSDYQLQRYQNGSSSISSSFDLSGSLGDGQTIVISHPDAAIYAGTTIKNAVIDYNGDDAMALFKKSTSSFVDIFGQIGTDPGSAWTVDGITTQNKTLIRKPTVTSGITQNPSSGFPSLGTEWIMSDIDDASNLGLHNFESVKHVGESDAILDPEFTFKPFLSSSIYAGSTVQLVNGAELFQFIIRDGGEDLVDEDELPTIVSKIQLVLNGFEQIDSIGLYMDNQVIAFTSSVENINTISFDNLSIPDGEQKTLVFKIVLKEELQDKVQVLASINKIEVSTEGSGFIDHSTNLILTPNDAPYNTIEVLADRVQFVKGSSDLFGFVDQTTTVQVKATDSFGNIDLDASSTQVALRQKTGSADISFVENSAETIQFLNGFATWKISYSIEETIQLEAQATYGTTVEDIMFIVYDVDSEVIAPGLLGQDLILNLRENYQVTTSLGYNGARDRMYAFIDNKNGTVTCVYTGFQIQVAQSTNSARGEAFDKGINTEHTWPQSLFDEQSPMVGDIHHLFPTRVDANGARSNYPFGEIDDNQTTTWYRNSSNQNSIPSVDIRAEFSEYLQGSRFEPREDHKGNVARAIFYFWTIYGGRANVADDAGFFNGMKDVLLTWHRLDLPDQNEITRSDTTAYYQGNRNPFVHDTSLVARAYFPETLVSNENVLNQPSQFELKQNFPNPFNPSTTISFTIQSNTFVQLDIFDMIGKKVATLVNKYQTSGTHNYTFDASNLSSGVYIYRLNTSEGSISKAMVLIK